MLPALIGIVPRGLPGSRFHQLSPLQGSYSAFGAFLDPVADKLIVSTALILLSAKPIAAGILMGNAWLLPTLSSGLLVLSSIANQPHEKSIHKPVSTQSLIVNNGC